MKTKELFYLSALCLLKEDKIIATDIVKRCIYVLQTEEGCLSAFIQHIINIQGSACSLACLPLTHEKFMISDQPKTAAGLYFGIQ